MGVTKVKVKQTKQGEVTISLVHSVAPIRTRNRPVRLAPTTLMEKFEGTILLTL